MRKRWKSVALCVESLLTNFAVIGAGIAAYEQEIFPALPVASVAALLAIIIAFGVPHD